MSNTPRYPYPYRQYGRPPVPNPWVQYAGFDKRKNGNGGGGDGGRNDSKDIKESPAKKPKSDVKIKIVKAPPVKSLEDLIKLGKQEDVRYLNIDTDMLRNIVPQLEELNVLIGMADLKKSIFYQILYFLQNMHRVGQSDFLHACIMGPPGCGKTTVARIISQMYKNAGILSPAGVFKVAGRADLIGKYLGQTAPKTRDLLTSCIGGVLFIDEIYSLGTDSTSSKDMYSQECVDTINQFLSEHKNDFCLIIAGYEEEINSRFFSINRGLDRRFPWKHHIAEYTNDEIARITEKMLNDIGWKTQVSHAEFAEIIKESKDIFRHSGGSVENWISKSKLAHSRRVFSLKYSEKYILSKQDFAKGIVMMKKSEAKANPQSEAPPMMYT